MMQRDGLGAFGRQAAAERVKDSAEAPFLTKSDPSTVQRSGGMPEKLAIADRTDEFRMGVPGHDTAELAQRLDP
jgi:hypothetical protein